MFMEIELKNAFSLVYIYLFIKEVEALYRRLKKFTKDFKQTDYNLEHKLFCKLKNIEDDIICKKRFLKKIKANKECIKKRIFIFLEEMQKCIKELNTLVKEGYSLETLQDFIDYLHISYFYDAFSSFLDSEDKEMLKEITREVNKMYWVC